MTGVNRFTYEGAKQHYESVAPIRGRVNDIRPCGTRRKDWMLVCKTTEGEIDIYSYRLYQTHCVKYLPETATHPETVEIQCGAWHTPSTAEFITMTSPFQCVKRKNRLWISVRDAESGYICMPLDSNVPVRLFRTPDMRWKVEDPTFFKRVINKDRAKVSRLTIKPFLDWVNMFMKLSDGWVTRAFYEDADERIMQRGKYEGIGKTPAAYLSTDDPDLYPVILRNILGTNIRASQYRQASSGYETQYDAKRVKAAILKLHDTRADIYDIVKVTAEPTIMGNVVDRPKLNH